MEYYSQAEDKTKTISICSESAQGMKDKGGILENRVKRNNAGSQKSAHGL